MRSTSMPGSTEKQTACLDASMPFRNRYQSGWPVSEAYCWRSSVSVGASLGRNKVRGCRDLERGISTTGTHSIQKVDLRPHGGNSSAFHSARRRIEKNKTGREASTVKRVAPTPGYCSLQRHRTDVSGIRTFGAIKGADRQSVWILVHSTGHKPEH